MMNEKFFSELERVWGKDSKMIDYCQKTASAIIDLADNDFYVIDKPTIETHFCFGYGLNGVSTQEDYERAADCEQAARTNEQYFIDENLKELRDYITGLENCLYYPHRHKVYKRVKYIGGRDQKDLIFCRSWETPYNKEAVLLSPDEIKAIIEAYQNEVAKFEKRLKTYLKRYGTKKLKTWTYLVD